MSSFLIEIPHSEDKIECMNAIKLFLDSGSHFLANADWGCSDGEHKAWLVVNVENREQAMQIVPPLYRSRAKIIELVKYTWDEAHEGLEYHKTQVN